MLKRIPETSYANIIYRISTIMDELLSRIHDFNGRDKNLYRRLNGILTSVDTKKIFNIDELIEKSIDGVYLDNDMLKRIYDNYYIKGSEDLLILANSHYKEDISDTKNVANVIFMPNMGSKYFNGDNYKCMLLKYWVYEDQKTFFSELDYYLSQEYPELEESEELYLYSII